MMQPDATEHADDDAEVRERVDTSLESPTARSFRTTVRQLAAVQKGAKGAPAYGRFVNRPLGRVFAAAAFHLGLTPDAVTGISAAFTAAGIVAIALAPHTPVAGLLIAASLVIGYALDSADGQLARLRGGGAPAGAWLDHMVDAVKISAFHLAVLIGLYRQSGVHDWLLIPMAFAVVAVVHFFATLLNEALRKQHGAVTRETPTAERPSVLRSLVVAPTDYGVLCLSFVLLGWTDTFLVVYGFLMVSSAGYLLLALPRWRAEMARLGSAREGRR